MKAIIIGQNHSVTNYTVNGRKRHIVESIPITMNREKVNKAVAVVGRDWAEVQNHMQCVMGCEMTKSLNCTIDNMTY